MSGTSADAIDAALVSVRDNTTQLESAVTCHYPDFVRAQILAVSANPHGTLADLCQLEQHISAAFAKAALALLDGSNVAKSDIQAIGSHGQTIIHQPTSTPAFTLQLSDTSLIAHLTGIDTIADFRRADLAAGGQGAPLVPAFHASVFGIEPTRVVLNLGGIANVTILAKALIEGFDTGPANTLLDAWCRTKTARRYDESGDWARTGTVVPELLEKLLQDRYFSLSPPKSTGPDYFSLDWLSSRGGDLEQYRDEDVQATLTELTALSIAAALGPACVPGTPILACGGGVRNTFLLERIARHTQGTVTLTSEYGVDCDFCEAMAFGWLAYRYKIAMPGNVPAVTGASCEKVLGALYPAS